MSICVPKAAMQLNALGELQKYMEKPEKKKKIWIVLFMPILTIAHWSGISVLVNWSEKLWKPKNAAWE